MIQTLTVESGTPVDAENAALAQTGGTNLVGSSSLITESNPMDYAKDNYRRSDFDREFTTSSYNTSDSGIDFSKLSKTSRNIWTGIFAFLVVFLLSTFGLGFLLIALALTSPLWIPLLMCFIFK